MNLEKVIAVRTDKTVYRDGDRCLKVFNEGYSKADVLNEALNQARIEETGLNIPRVLEVTVIDGKWTIVSDYIKGKTLAQLMQENPEKKDEYLNLFVDLQLEMHSKTCPLLNKLKDKMNRKICQTDLSATVRYDLHTRLESMPKHNKVCHGDFNPSNVIVGDDGQLYVCDWAHATQGSPAADVATTYLLFALNSKDQAEAYLELYCDRADMPMQVVRQWTSIVAASELARKRNVNDEFLKNWIDVVDYQ